jgi:hypothetical protein
LGQDVLPSGLVHDISISGMHRLTDSFPSFSTKLEHMMAPGHRALAQLLYTCIVSSSLMSHAALRAYSVRDPEDVVIDRTIRSSAGATQCLNNNDNGNVRCCDLHVKDDAVYSTVTGRLRELVHFLSSHVCRPAILHRKDSIPSEDSQREPT